MRFIGSRFRLEFRGFCFMFGTLLISAMLFAITAGFGIHQDIESAEISQLSVPEVAVVTEDGVTHIVSVYTQVDKLHYLFEDAATRAMVTYLGHDRWKLDLQAKRRLLRTYFPFQTQRTPMADQRSDEIFYYPRMLGFAEKASARDANWAWAGFQFRYPGEVFAPLVVLAGPNRARMVAATNWPPKVVRPLYGAERLTMLYAEAIPSNASASFEAMVVEVEGNSAYGDVPWQLALDRYRAWLDTKVAPPRYPGWMWQGQGFMDAILPNQENYPYDIRAIHATYESRKSLYPWIQFWGQMRPPNSRICCALDQEMDAAYLPTLPEFARAVAAGGGHVGYYSAPFYGPEFGDPRPRLNLDNADGQEWLASWIAQNERYGANAYYIDTIGWDYYGDPVEVMNLFQTGFVPKNTLIEGVTDIYPAASLVAGALAGGRLGNDEFCGAPFKTPETSDRTTFPRFGRYLFGDRLLYGGLANQDSTFWGELYYWTRLDYPRFKTCGYVEYCKSNGPCEYGTEKLAFLLGEKLEVRPPFDRNEIVNAIVEERIRTNWWERRPVYLDTRGLDLTAILPATKVEVARFRDKGGHTLFAISNPNLIAGLSFRFNGMTIAVPVQKIAILEALRYPPGRRGRNKPGVDDAAASTTLK